MKLSQNRLLKFRYESNTINLKQNISLGKSSKTISVSYTGESITTQCVVLDKDKNVLFSSETNCSLFDYFNRRTGIWVSMKKLIIDLVNKGENELATEILDNFISYRKNSRFVNWANSDIISDISDYYLRNNLQNYDNIGI